MLVKWAATRIPVFAGEFADLPDPAPDRAHCAAALVRLRGIGANDALLLGAELFHRDFRNRRELASLAGLAPVPFASGGIDHDQGISKAGSPMLRRRLAQMAWRWLCRQPAGQRSVEMAPELRQRPRRAVAQTRDNRAGAQAAGGAVEIRHLRAGAGRRRPVAGLRG